MKTDMTTTETMKTGKHPGEEILRGLSSSAVVSTDGRSATIRTREGSIICRVFLPQHAELMADVICKAVRRFARHIDAMRSTDVEAMCLCPETGNDTCHCPPHTADCDARCESRKWQLPRPSNTDALEELRQDNHKT